MAVKFPLEMKDGVQVRNISELKENFDVEKVVGYFLDGKLKKWLDARWYEDESEVVSRLDENDTLLAKHLCEIFGVEYNENEINAEEIVSRNERLTKLKQYTDDEAVIGNVDAVAFDQEELAELYDKDLKTIYLCEGEFVIPKSKSNLEYKLISVRNVEGLDVTEKITEKAVEQRDIINICKPLLINENDSKKIQNKHVYINNVIKCKGILEFENCEIYCDDFDEKKADIYFGIGHLISVNKGEVYLNNCKIHHNVCSEKICFVGGRSSKLAIRGCEIVNTRNLLGNFYDGKVLIEDSQFVEVSFPISFGYVEELTLSHCNIEPANGEARFTKVDSQQEKKFLFAQIKEGLVTDCTFRETDTGIFSSAKKIIFDKSTFKDCQVILNDVESANIRNSIFENCVHPFLNTCRQPDETLNIFNCKFINTFGKIEAGNLIAEECEWKKGFFKIDIPRYTGKSNGIKFLKCIFKYISPNNISDYIKMHENKGYISKSDLNELYEKMDVFLVPFLMLPWKIKNI